METFAAILTITTAFAEPVPMTFNATDQTVVLYRFSEPEKTEEGKQYPLVLIEDTAVKHPIDRKRIYVTGLSMGGFGTWDLLARAPQTWASAIPICGGVDKKTAPSFKHVPIRIHHGAADNVVPPEASNIMAKALGNIGGKATIREYRGLGHDSWTQTYRDREVIKWLFTQRKPD